MQSIGDVLGAARRSAAGFEAWLDSADPELSEEIRTAVTFSGESPAAFARAAVADFSRFADEEAWGKLTRLIRDDPDPGAACLAAMVRWRMAATACTSHSL